MYCTCENITGVIKSNQIKSKEGLYVAGAKSTFYLWLLPSGFRTHLSKKTGTVVQATAATTKQVLLETVYFSLHFAKQKVEVLWSLVSTFCVSKHLLNL
jgi:hypothetical protein